jgi:hypothetical protein
VEVGVLDILLRGQGLLVFVLTGAVGLAGWMLRAHILQVVADRTKGAASAEVVKALDDRLDAHDGRLARIETALRHLPTAEQMQALNLLVADLRGEVRASNAKLDGVEKIVGSISRRVELIDEHLKRSSA